MTTLAEMRSEVARDHGWHEDDDGDRIDEVLNERFGQAAVEMYAALETGRDLVIGDTTGVEWKRACHAFIRAADSALSKARQP
jgi:hypothetical protein